MSVMYIVLPLALVFAGFAVWAFIWAVRQGQLDDLQTPAARMLLDEDEAPRTPPPNETLSQGREEHPDAEAHDGRKT
ncbi:MAG: cbb3-type cytochrome oxidase assembly protein CcoS [Phycisphaerales bacterium]|nr:cbb3-type cytochrome oxidase assembly protein CcoS [Phycisphaerales bacterium]